MKRQILLGTIALGIMTLAFSACARKQKTVAPVQPIYAQQPGAYQQQQAPVPQPYYPAQQGKKQYVSK